MWGSSPSAMMGEVVGVVVKWPANGSRDAEQRRRGRQLLLLPQLQVDDAEC